MILDDFSARAFDHEWDLVFLTRDSWRTQLGEGTIDFLFVESAWSGNSGSWKYQLTGSSGPKAEFQELLSWCRGHGIPSVFWNKEDPPHYADFLPAARLFDVVLTSDENRIPDYHRDLGHARVAVLPFAAQPAIHNPVRPPHGWHARDVAFAGMYFAHKFPERRQQMQDLLGGALDAGQAMTHGLEIFSRELDGDANYQFPAPFGKRVVGSLGYDQMLTAYKAYKVFLNVNSVTESPSMCARRIFEITASGTPVISAPSAALPEFFPGGEIPVAGTRTAAANLTAAMVRNPELGSRSVHQAQRRIWAAHSYAHRAEAVVALVLPERSRPVRLPSVTALVSASSPQQLDHIFSTFAAQRGVEAELVLLTEDFFLTGQQRQMLQAEYGVGPVKAVQLPQRLGLGGVLNLGVGAADGDVLALMDCTDYYGPHYLNDQLQALAYSRAAVVGKQAHFTYFPGANASVFRAERHEHRFTDTVTGSTILGARSVFREHPFEDVARDASAPFLAALAAAGGSIYSADKYNYFQQTPGARHSWSAADRELLATGAVAFFGSPREHITI
ncbi:glycosyltransferase family protein [Pseudarthrobacter sp. P1]|uniref:glycosyltransferase family protein n=1 Tax=Pseudarthrobacter sp. P1 TaxID=3418418 RepID=UPI003CE72ECC